MSATARQVADARPTAEVFARWRGGRAKVWDYTPTLSRLTQLTRDQSVAQQLIESTIGDRPEFFRAPAGLRNPFLDPILARLGLELASWTRRGFDTVARRPATVLQRLVRRLGGGDILLLHDGHAARTLRGVPVILEVLPALIDSIVAARLVPVTLRSAARPQ